MSTKHTLRDLVASGLVQCGDELYFQFKDKTFTCKLHAGGILGHCTCNGEPIFMSRDGFVSLTDWTDTCIQEILYVTRFSSWKRVKHRASETPLITLRERLWRSKAPLKVDFEAALMVERRKVMYLTQQLAHFQRQVEVRQDVGGDDNPFRLKF